MAVLETKIVAAASKDLTGRIWLRRREDIYKDGVFLTSGPIDVQEVAPEATQGPDKFNLVDGAPSLIDLQTLAGDEWPALSAMQTSMKDKQAA